MPFPTSKMLSKLDAFILEVLTSTPQISMVLPMYYEFHDLLHDVSDKCGEFSDLDPDIVTAVKEGMKKYEKYYTFMDESDTHYTATVLDPRAKG
jgi:hypothetical protein